MVQFSYVINDELGLHARPAGLLVKLASGFTSTITLKCENGEADAKSLIALMQLGIQKGSNVQFTVAGDDEKEAVAALEQFMKEKL